MAAVRVATKVFDWVVPWASKTVDGRAVKTAACLAFEQAVHWAGRWVVQLAVSLVVRWAYW